VRSPPADPNIHRRYGFGASRVALIGRNHPIERRSGSLSVRRAHPAAPPRLRIPALSLDMARVIQGLVILFPGGLAT